MSLQLILKSASMSIEDFKIECDMEWTVGQLKEKISLLYPTKPKKEHQKLIYGGKLLPDDLSLIAVLNKVQDIHIVHLVCPVSSITNSNQNENKNVPSVASKSVTVPPTNPLYSQINPGMINSSSLTSDVPPVANVPVFNPAPDAFQQYLTMQQMYAQFMTQYLSQYNGSVPPIGIPYGPAAPTPDVQQAAEPVHRQNTPAVEERRRRPQEEDQDYIDYLYIFSRALIFGIILYHYSSFSRVLIVTLMFLVISLYVKMNREQRLSENRQRVNHETAEVPASQPVPADIQPENSEQVSENSTTEATSTEQPVDARSILSTFSTIVTLGTSFFTSLIPSEPVPVNAN